MPRSIGLPESLTFRELLDALPVAAYSCDADGLITYANASAIELWGREPLLNDPADRFCGSFRLYTPAGEPIAHDTCWMALALRDAQPFSNREIVIEREDGIRRTVLANAKPFLDKAGAVVGAINVLMDISAQKHAETRLIAAKSAITSASRAKSDFLANLSHELRTPLNSILGYAEALHDGHFGALADRQIDYVGHIVTAGRLLHKLVDDLLDISRVEARKLPLNSKKTDLRRIVGASIELLHGKGQEAGVEIRTDLPRRPVPVIVDPIRIEQVLVNLIGNAVKYSRRGVEVVVRIYVMSDDAGGVRIDIEDRGKGMRPEEIKLALKPFRRLATSMHRDTDGAGLGLPLAVQLIKLHGGKLDVDSKPGVGTTVHVWLPPERCAAGLKRLAG